MKIKQYFPNFVSTVESDNPETSEFFTKKELLEIPFVKRWSEFRQDYHFEMEFTQSELLKENFCYLILTSEDMASSIVVGIIRNLSESEMDEMRKWFPEWKMPSIGKIETEYKEYKRKKEQ